MIHGLIVAVCLASPSEAADYFPLEPGTTWVYSDSQAPEAGFEDRVGNPQPIDGKQAVPIVTTIRGQVDGSTFYRVEGDTVLLVAFEQNRPLKNPYPVFKLSGGKDGWSYTGMTQWFGEPAPITMKGTARKTKNREVLGEDRETIEVTIDAVIGDSDGVNMKSHQVAIYAKGIGLVELKDKTKMNKSTTERKRTLVSFTPGKSS